MLAAQCFEQVGRIIHVWRRDEEYKGQGVMKLELLRKKKRKMTQEKLNKCSKICYEGAKTTVT